MRMRTYGDFDREFREEAVKLVAKKGRPLETIASDLGVPASTLRRWYVLAMGKKKGARFKKGGIALPVSDPEAESPEEKIERLERENAQLRKENAALQMDRSILKKAAAFFAKESE